MLLENFLKLVKVKKTIHYENETKYAAICPAHKDKSPSLYISQGQKGILLHCHAGCTLGNVLAALGLWKRDLFNSYSEGQRLVVASRKNSWVDFIFEEYVSKGEHETALACLLHRIPLKPYTPTPEDEEYYEVILGPCFSKNEKDWDEEVKEIKDRLDNE